MSAPDATAFSAPMGRLRHPAWLLTPAALLYGAMAVAPLIVILQMSFSEGLGAYARVLTNPLLAPILVNTQNRQARQVVVSRRSSLESAEALCLQL